MDIQDKHRIYLKMCNDYALMSKCRKIKVGCIIVNKGRIVSTGTNGTPKGQCNCTDHFYAHNDTEFLEQHSEWSKDHEIHAEMNALLYAAKSNVEVTSDCVMYCTHEPCNNCLKHIAVTGIKQIYYDKKYYGNTFNNKYKINITQIELIEKDNHKNLINNLTKYATVEDLFVTNNTGIIVNGRKKFIKGNTITRKELVELEYDNVTPEIEEMCRVTFGKTGQYELLYYNYSEPILIKHDYIFHVTLTQKGN